MAEIIKTNNTNIPTNTNVNSASLSMGIIDSALNGLSALGGFGRMAADYFGYNGNYGYGYGTTRTWNNQSPLTNEDVFLEREIMSLVKFKLNAMPHVQENVKRQLELIDKVSSQSIDEERKNLMELNDYMRNYSHLTFDEYKRLKNGEDIKVSKKQKEDKK